MNKHVELVKKWLADKDSVSKEELKANAYDANAAANASYYAYAHAAKYATDATYYPAIAVYAADAAANAAAAEYWVSHCEDLVDE